MNFVCGNLINSKIIDKTKHLTLIKNNEFSKDKQASNKAIFLDRDGVLIKDVHYISEPKDVLILEGVIDLIKLSKEQGFINIIITNQSGIERKLFNWEDYEIVTNRMLKLINIQDCFNAIYASGEGPSISSSKKSWRKPNPNMILKAAKDFNIDLTKSILIGDRYSDLLSGNKAGIFTLIHLLTGHGLKERELIIKNYGNFDKNSNLYLLKDLNSLFIKKLLQNKS